MRLCVSTLEVRTRSGARGHRWGGAGCGSPDRSRRKVSAPLPGGGDRRMAWGKEVDVAVVAEVEDGGTGRLLIWASTAPRDLTTPACSTTVYASACRVTRDCLLICSDWWRRGLGSSSRAEARRAPLALVGASLRFPGPLPHEVEEILDDLFVLASRAPCVRLDGQDSRSADSWGAFHVAGRSARVALRRLWLPERGRSGPRRQTWKSKHASGVVWR